MSRLVGLFVGISNFAERACSDIRVARDDAIVLADTFEKHWASHLDNRICILTESPTRAEILAHLSQSVEFAESRDTFVFYFSGHGVMQNSKAFLVPRDGLFTSIIETCIALETVLDIVKTSPASKKLIIIEACHAGIQTLDGFTLSTLTSVPSVEEFRAGQFIALISAGSAHQSVCEGPVHSLFTESLIHGIRNLASTGEYIDLMALFKYVRDYVVKDTEGRQCPSMSFSGATSYLNLTARTQEEPTMRFSNVLVVFANPKGSDPLRLGNEDRVIHECIERSKHRENIHLEIKHAARVDDFARALLEGEYRIVQFSGHGTGQGLALENEVGEVQIVPKDALAETLSDYSPPIECVILNACYSNVHERNLSMRVPYTIVMDGPISDEGATEFTRGFYDAIGADKGIEFAHKEGCRRIKLKGLPDSAVPVLYKKPAA